jgi:hypothetical protein
LTARKMLIGETTWEACVMCAECGVLTKRKGGPHMDEDWRETVRAIAAIALAVKRDNASGAESLRSQLTEDVEQLFRMAQVGYGAFADFIATRFGSTGDQLLEEWVRSLTVDT